jgi:anti-anti-sigma regulatory factor
VSSLQEERIDDRSTLLSVHGEARELDSGEVVRRIEEDDAERVILDLTGAVHVEAGLGDALSELTDRLGEAGRRLVVVSGDPDLRQALGLAGGETIVLAASRDEAFARLR